MTLSWNGNAESWNQSSFFLTELLMSHHWEPFLFKPKSVSETNFQQNGAKGACVVWVVRRCACKNTSYRMEFLHSLWYGKSDNLATGMDKLPSRMLSWNIPQYNYTPVPSLKYSFSAHSLIQCKPTETWINTSTSASPRNAWKKKKVQWNPFITTSVYATTHL
jgi:hypothetical protein